MTLLALLPASLIACVLAIYFTVTRIGDAEDNLRDAGVSTAQHVAASAEYGVVSGNHPILQNLVKSAVGEGRAEFVLVVDRGMRRLASAGRVPANIEASLSVAQPPRASAAQYIFIAPVQLSPIELDDAFLPEEASATPVSNAPLGWAIVGMSRAPLIHSKQRMLLGGLGIALAGLAVAGLLALALGRSVSRPIRQLSKTVAELGRGNFGARVKVDSGGELQLLQQGFNQMAEVLQTNQAELEQRIHQATAGLEQKREEAEQANRAKSSFLAAVSHDLRQPMHAIGLFAATLKRQVGSTPQAELVQRIEESVSALQAMFDGLLNISRLDSGMLEPRLEACDLAALLRHLSDECQPSADQKGLRLSVHTPSAWVSTDVMLLSRMLGNLIANAIRYTEEGGVLIGCRKRGASWLVQVWDTGIGIQEENFPRIFEEYFQVGNVERNRRQGVGLGLAIVSRIGRLLGYPVTLRSRVGKGSVFSITIPAVPAISVQGLDHHAETNLGQFKAERVLVIDDDEGVRDSMLGLLGSWGLHALAAESLEDAQQVLSDGDFSPQLIICDYRLPQASGLETVATLRQRLAQAGKGSVPAVLISGDTAPESAAQMQTSGLPVLYKPVQPAKLRTVISRLLLAQMETKADELDRRT